MKAFTKPQAWVWLSLQVLPLVSSITITLLTRFSCLSCNGLLQGCNSCRRIASDLLGADHLQGDICSVTPGGSHHLRSCVLTFHVQPEKREMSSGPALLPSVSVLAKPSKMRRQKYMLFIGPISACLPRFGFSLPFCF